MSMKLTMSLNFLLLVAMVTTNILSLYHLSSSSFFLHPTPPPPPLLPSQLLHQLHTVRATINHLTRLQPPPKPTSTTPSDLITYSHISPIASSCHSHPELLHRYMTYTPFSLCPQGNDTQLAEALILRGCHPLPRRRCFSRTPPNPKFSFDFESGTRGFNSYKSELDLTIPQLMDIAKRANSAIRLGIDIGGGAGNFAAAMRQRNVTIMTTTMNLGAPYSEANAVRGLLALHAPLQQRLPVFDGTMDIVRSGHAVNRWVPVAVLEFLLFDVDRVLREGGFLWIDHFFSKEVDLENVYKPLIKRLGYKIVKWANGEKRDTKNGEFYLTALLQKPNPR